MHWTTTSALAEQRRDERLAAAERRRLVRAARAASRAGGPAGPAAHQHNGVAPRPGRVRRVPRLALLRSLFRPHLDWLTRT